MKVAKICNNVIALILLAVVFAMPSCSKDDDDKENIEIEPSSDDNPTTLLIGSWEADNFDAGKYTYAYLSFNENGTGKWSDQKVPNSYENFEFTFDGQKLRIRDTDYPLAIWDTIYVNTLTKSGLTIEFEDNYDGKLSESFHKVVALP